MTAEDYIMHAITSWSISFRDLRLAEVTLWLEYWRPRDKPRFPPSVSYDEWLASRNSIASVV